MNPDHAGQIAELLNSRNRLVVRYDADRVLKQADSYLYELSDDGIVIACSEVKRVQWYQFEILHLTVAPEFARQGFATRLLDQAEARAMHAGVRILQCTIRDDNQITQDIAAKRGFSLASRFYNPPSGHNVGVWQKVLSPPL